MNNNLNYTTELEKIMGVSAFTYRGCEVKREWYGYVVLGQKCLNMDYVDMIIDSALQSLSKSILR